MEVIQMNGFRSQCDFVVGFGKERADQIQRDYQRERMSQHMCDENARVVHDYNQPVKKETL
jgi:hypothetical protein